MTIYLDLDGVLADFDGAFQKHFEMTPNQFEGKHGTKDFWKSIFTVKDYFLNLKPMADATDLVHGSIKLGFKPVILTGLPMPREGICVASQKRTWVDTYLGPQFAVITCYARQKAEFCKPGDVLIDDRTTYQKKWQIAGGKYIVHTSAAQSLKELAHYLETGE